MILGECQDRQTRSGRGVTNGMRADPCGFTNTYESVKKDTVVYGSGMWIHMHDT
jgi:hypothetical protein